MEPLSALGRAIRVVRERPATLAVGLLFALAELATMVLAFVGAAATGGGWAPFAWVGVQRLLLLAVSAAILPGLYELVRDENVTRGTVGTLVATARRSGVNTLGALLVAWTIAVALGVVVAVVAVALVLAVDTGLVATGLFGGLLRIGFWYGVVLGLAVLVALALARLPVAFADLHAIDGVSPRTAWRESAHAIRTRPRTALGYAVGRWGLLVAPWGAATVTLLADAGVVPAIVVFVAGTAVSRTVLAAYHVEVHEATAATKPARAAPPLVRPRRVALAGVLVVGLCVGVGAVRVADVGTTAAAGPPAVDGGSDDPGTVLARAHARSTTAPHRSNATLLVRNDTTGEWDRVFAIRGTYDPADRQALFRLESDDLDPQIHYLAEGVRAIRIGDSSDAAGPASRLTDSALLRQVTARGPWVVATRPTYPAGVQLYPRLNDTLDWQVGADRSDVVVYELTDPNQLQYSEVGDFPPVAEATYLNGSAVRIAVDRDDARIRWIRAREHYRLSADDDPIDSRSIRRFRYGDVDVQRPAPIDPPPAWAAVWDLFVY